MRFFRSLGKCLGRFFGVENYPDSRARLVRMRCYKMREDQFKVVWTQSVCDSQLLTVEHSEGGDKFIILNDNKEAWHHTGDLIRFYYDPTPHKDLMAFVGMDLLESPGAYFRII